MKRTPAEILREYGPFSAIEVGRVHGVTFDGTHVWFATDDRLHALNPGTGQIERSLAVPASAGTAFDGRHLFQIADRAIQKIDAVSGRVLGTIPVPPCAPEGPSGLAWAEGSLWLGDYAGRKIHEIDPATGAVRRTLPCNRFVTGVTWAGGELWHGSWDGAESELRRLDPRTGAVQESLVLPQGTFVSGVESDGGERLFCGGGRSGKVVAVRRPRKSRSE